IRRQEQPIIRWQDPNDTAADSRFRRGFDIVLGEIKVRNCALADPISGVVRRNAVPPTQPYVAAGETIAGSTEWRHWPETGTPVGLATTVSTSSAGFRVTPKYQAHIVGERVFPSFADLEPPFGVVEGYAQVANSTASSFDLLVLLPDGRTATVDFDNLRLNPPEVMTKSFLGRLQVELQWHVVW